MLKPEKEGICHLLNDIFSSKRFLLLKYNLQFQALQIGCSGFCCDSIALKVFNKQKPLSRLIATQTLAGFFGYAKILGSLTTQDSVLGLKVN